jgi:polysaccharide export outer membrane protein
MNCNNFSRAVRFTLLVAAASLFGCTHALKSTPNAEGNQGVFKHASGHDSSINEYVVDPPDEIVIKAPNIKEIDGSKQVVRPDGKITLNLLKDVKISGLTPAQIQQQLTELASKYYGNPDIRVEVLANSKFYQVFGRGVNQQGKRPYTGNDTVIKALAEAGLSENAWPQQVWVVRPGKGGQEPARAVVNFQKMAETGDLSQNYVLQENDIITVPDSPLASFNFKATQIAGPITGATDAGSSVRAVGAR